MKRHCFILFCLATLLSCKKQDVQPAENATSVDNAETVKPTVSFISPHAGDTLHDSIVIKVSATDASGIAQVLVKIDGVNLSKPDKIAPYEFGWNTRKVKNGHHTILAKATDIFKNARSKSIDVVVNNRDTIRDT